MSDPAEATDVGHVEARHDDDNRFYETGVDREPAGA